MGADGQTRRLSLSLSFLWIVGGLAFLALASLGLIAYLWVEAVRTRDSLAYRLEFQTRQVEIAKYQKDLDAAPAQAQILLAELEKVARSADGAEDDDQSPGALSANPKKDPQGRNNPNPSASPPVANPPLANTTSTNPSSTSPQNSAPANLSSDPNSQGAGEKVESQGSEGSSGDESAGAEGEKANSGQDPNPGSPEAKAWAVFWNAWPAPPAENDSLAVTEFKIAPNGNFNFVLRQTEEPGVRAKGRSAAIFAVADAKGQVKLAAVPDFPALEPKAGFTVGARYNILSSKVVKGRVAVPPGGSILSVEIVAWDEDSQELVLRERLRLGK
jgi:hypothetical protein